MKKILLPIILATATVFALSSTIVSANTSGLHNKTHNWNFSTPPVDLTIKAAVSENRKAKRVGFEWRDTAKMIKKAKKLAKAGKIAAAIKLANAAKRQAINAQHQALVAKSAGPHLF